MTIQSFKLRSSVVLMGLGLLGSGLVWADNANPQQLEAVKVRATPVRALVNKNNIIQSTGADMRDIMADRVDAGIGGGSIAGQWVSIRGAGQNRIDMVVDNAASTNQMWVHQTRFQLDPSMIKNLTIEKGAGSASAGIGASNGAIRATTVDARDLLRDDKPIGARVGFNYRSNKGVNGNAAIYANQNGWDALLLGSWQKDDDYKDGKGRIVTNSGLNQDNYLGKLSYQINDNHRISGSFRQEHFDGDMSIRPEFRCFNNCANGEQQPIETKQQTTNLEYKGSDLGKLGNIDANFYHIRSEDKRKPFGTGGWATGNFAQQTATGKTTGANLGFTTPIGENHRLKYGVNFREEKVASLNVREGKREYGVYAEGIWDFAPFTLTTGLRYDHFKMDLPLNGWKGLTLSPAAARDAGKYTYPTTQSASTVSPSIALLWEATPNLSLNAKWAQVSRSPQLDYPVRASGTGVPTTLLRRSVMAGIKPERSQTAEIGANWKHGSLNINGNVFYQNIKDYVDLLPSVANPDYPNLPVNSARPWTNVGNVKSHGYELNAAYKINNLTARVGTMYNKVKSEGFALTADGRSLLPQGQQYLTSLAYRFNQPKLEIGWRGRYAQGITFKGVDSRSNSGTYRRSGYGVHDVFANWQPLGHDAFNVNFAVNNVGNKLYRSHSQAADSITDTNPRTFPEPGREFRVSVNYRF